MAWTLDLLSLDGGSTIATATKFRSARLTWAYDGSGAAEIALMPEDVASGDWLYGRRRVLFNDSGTAKFGGRLDRLERAGTPGAVKYRATARGLGAMLNKRVAHPALIDLNTRSTEIATDLIANVVAQPDDMTNFTIGTIHGTAPFRDRFICDSANVPDAIQELADLDFSWEIGPTGIFQAWVGGRGTDLSGSVSLSPDRIDETHNVIDWNDVADTTELATYVTGNIDAGECDPFTLIDSSALASDYGREEVVLDEDDKTDPDELSEKTAEELRARAASGSSLNVAWIEGRGAWDFGDVWLGDVVNVERGAEFGGDADMRVITVNLTLEPGVHEFVEYELELA